MKEFPPAGEMNERINIVSYGSTITDGEKVNTETVSSAIPAQRLYSAGGAAGGEKDLSGQLMTVETVNFLIRYDGSITTEKKVRWYGQDRDIRRIEIIGRNRYMRIITVEHGN